MLDIILVVGIVAIAAGAYLYLRKQKKNGSACPGCSHKGCASQRQIDRKLDKAIHDSCHCKD